MATHSGQLFPARDPIPASRNTTVNHWMSQKFQIPKSLSRNNIPAISTNTPQRLLHFLHPSISLTSGDYRNRGFKKLVIGLASFGRGLKRQLVGIGHKKDVDGIQRRAHEAEGFNLKILEIR